MTARMNLQVSGIDSGTSALRRRLGAGFGILLLCAVVLALLPAANAQEASAPTPGMAPPPKVGLKSNRNYYLYNDGKPILGLIVVVELTKDVVCDDVGFHVQLNANSPLGSATHWQQYVMGFNANFKDGDRFVGPIVGSSIEFFAKPNSFDTGGGKFPHRGPLRHLPAPKTLPAGAKFTIALLNEGDNIVGAEFTYAEKGGKERHNWTIPVPPPTPPYPPPAIPKSVRAPVVAFQVDIVGANSGNRANMKSGEGKIIYTASSPMTVVAKKPPSEGALTAETANSVYGELPVGPSNTFTQTFVVDPDAAK